MTVDWTPIDSWLFPVCVRQYEWYSVWEICPTLPYWRIMHRQGGPDGRVRITGAHCGQVSAIGHLQWLTRIQCSSTKLVTTSLDRRGSVESISNRVYSQWGEPERPPRNWLYTVLRLFAVNIQFNKCGSVQKMNWTDYYSHPACVSQ